MKTKNIVVLLLTFCLALGMAACTTRSDAEMPRQMQEFTEETLAPEVPAQEQAVPSQTSTEADGVPETEMPAEESGDERSVTDEELLELLEQNGAQVFLTTDGSVRAVCDGLSLRVARA